MKNRKTVVVAFLLVAMLLIGVGFAQLTDQLLITGSAGVDADDSQEVFDGDIYFSKVINGTGCTAEILSDPDQGEITVTAGALKEVGNEVIATYTIKSESDLDVTVTPSIVTSNPTYFTVTTSWNDTAQVLPAGSTIDITVTVKLARTAEEDQSTTFTITLDAKS